MEMATGLPATDEAFPERRESPYGEDVPLARRQPQIDRLLQ